jgi:archaemetzincin
MGSEHILLVTFGYFEKDLLEQVRCDVENEYLIPVQLKEGHLDLSEFYDSSRRQYDGNRILKELDKDYGCSNSKTLGLFNVDLFIPILTYIFGQAYLNGRTGIASMYRLSNEKYGITKENMVLSDRFRKEVIHELGHTFGLIHCFNPACVMRSSTYVEDIDQKKHSLCGSCREKLRIAK